MRPLSKSSEIRWIGPLGEFHLNTVPGINMFQFYEAMCQIQVTKTSSQKGNSVRTPLEASNI